LKVRRTDREQRPAFMIVRGIRPVRGRKGPSGPHDYGSRAATAAAQENGRWGWAGRSARPGWAARSARPGWAARSARPGWAARSARPGWAARSARPYLLRSLYWTPLPSQTMITNSVPRLGVHSLSVHEESDLGRGSGVGGRVDLVTGRRTAASGSLHRPNLSDSPSSRPRRSGCPGRGRAVPRS
jgi:hypothetical protein